MKNQDKFNETPGMHGYRILLMMLICVMTLTAAPGQEKESVRILNAAIYQEEINGNLQEAVRMYEDVVEKYPGDRAAVAEALYRSGLANEKLGTQKARTYYEKVVNNYPEQSKMAGLAQNRLNLIQKKEIQNVFPVHEEITLSRIYSDPDFYGSSSKGGRYLTSIDWLNCNLYFMNPQDGRKQYVTSQGNLNEPGACADLSAWSSDGRFIAYGFSDSSGFHVFIYDVEKDRSRKLLSAYPDKYIAPLEWTRDGSHLLIERGNSTGLNLQLLSVSQGTIRELPGLDDLDLSYQGMPTVSPRMEYLLYHTKVDGKRKINLYNIKTGKMNPLVQNRFDNWGMIWEEDESSFIFASDQSGSPALYRLRLKDGDPTGEPELLYENINSQFKPLSISDEGSLVFQSSANLESIRIADIDLQTGNTVKLENLFEEQEGNIRNPVWSNDGRKIASMMNPSTIYIYNTESGQEDRIKLDFRVFSGGWNQWSPDDNEFLVEQVEINGNNHAIVNLNTREVEFHEDLGKYVVFQGADNLIYTTKDQKDIRIKNRTSGEHRSLCRIENEDQYYFLRTSPDQRKLAFFEGNSKTTYWKDLSRLWVLDIESERKELVWECRGNEYFGWGIVNWTADSDKLMVFFGADKTADQGENLQFHPYAISLNTKEKTRLEKIVDELSNFKQGDFHPRGDRFIYSSMEQTTNVWLLQNLK